MDWLKLLYELFGARHPVLSLIIAMIFGAVLFGGGWWLIGRAYEKSQTTPITTTTEKPQNPVVREPAPPQTRQPLPIREDMDAYQVPTVRELIRQMGVSEMWLSQVMQRGRQGGLDGIPVGGAVDYSAAIKKLESGGEIEILEVANRTYPDFWGESLGEDVRFRVKNLGPRVRSQLRSPL